MSGILGLGIPAFVFIVFALVFVYASRVKKVGPNEALIISGRGESFSIITGGRKFVVPVIERADYLSLELMTIDVTTPDVPTLEGVPVTVEGVAQIKIGNDENSIRTAAVQFLSKDQDQIKYVAHETLAGHLRAILGTLTVEKLYQDREAFAQKVQEVSGDDMASMGMEIVSFVIKDVNDSEGYLEALGRTRIAQVKRDAQIGEAEAERDATIRSAEAREKGKAAHYENETLIAESKKKYEVEQAIYQAEINRQQAEAMLASDLQENITNQTVKAEAVQIQVVAKQKQIEVEEQEVKRREQELDATIRKPAEAEAYRVQQIADAKRYRLQAEAEGEAEAIRKRGEAEAAAARAKGLAEAEVIRQQGLAEAEATQKKAEAWENYTQAAIMQQLIDALPEVASAIAQPLAKTDRIVIVSNGGDSSDGVGASKITQDITNIVAQVPATLEALTGVNLTSTIANLPGLKANRRSDDSAE